MKVRAKAPLRLGIAGGGTDVSPYSDVHQGAVLNATINLYAHTFLEEIPAGSVQFEARDLGVAETFETGSVNLNAKSGLLLHRAVYCRIVKEFLGGREVPVRVMTYADAPMGSGLGSSSAVVVSMLEAYREAFSLPLGEYDLAKLAFEIERFDCGLSGGKQDQYAAAFGGFNFIEFGPKGSVVVNPLRIRRHIINELQANVVLFYTGASRDSAKIIGDQIGQITRGGASLEAMHQIKKSAYELKRALLKGEVSELALSLQASWQAKKRTSSSISNAAIDELEHKITEAGAISMKVSGAGGGGFAMIMCPPDHRHSVKDALNLLPGSIVNFEFTLEGAHSWTV